jgi:hypothetical protein
VNTISHSYIAHRVRAWLTAHATNMAIAVELLLMVGVGTGTGLIPIPHPHRPGRGGNDHAR